MEHDSFGIAQTADFILKTLPPCARRILDVGAGRGKLTAALRKHQFEVTAIDNSMEAVNLARDSGIAVDKSDITSFETKVPFDGVVFSMSAHHVHPLGKAMDQAANALRPNGTVIFEEYAIEEVDEKTAKWHYETLALLVSLGLFETERNPFDDLRDPLAAWRKEHSSHDDHHFNTGAELIAAVKRKFQSVTTEWVPYFYRYFTPKTDFLAKSDLGEKLYGLELSLIESDHIKPIGVRIVGRLP